MIASHKAGSLARSDQVDRATALSGQRTGPLKTRSLVLAADDSYAVRSPRMPLELWPRRMSPSAS